METASEKRDKLYSSALKASLIFGILLVMAVAVYKLNEDYFNGNAKIQQLLESINAKEDEVTYPKVNIKVNFSDEGDKSLAIVLPSPIEADKVTVHEEFTRNKYVITLNGYKENITDEISLRGDLDIMDAAGAYYQNSDVTIETYCEGIYDYNVTISDTTVTVNFRDVESDYDYKAVMWIPYTSDNRASVALLDDELWQMAEEYGVKIYPTWALDDEYSQEDIVEFANNIEADLLMGVDIERIENTGSYMKGICNTSYFMSEYNSAKLAVDMVAGFAQIVDYEITDFEEADSTYPIVQNAVVPSATIKLCVSQKVNEYGLSRDIVNALENTLNIVMTEWRNSDNESE